MTDRLSLSVVIPAYNEEARIGPTLDAYARHLVDRRVAGEILVVDDGSTDRTSAVVREVGRRQPMIRLIRLAKNHGKGYAVRSGVVNASGHLILFADADGATPLTELGRLERALDRGADIAIGSRAVPDPTVRVERKLYRHLMGRAFHALVRGLTVRGINDTQCGFKLFKFEVAQDLFSRMRMAGFSFDVELLMMAQRRGYRIAEVPINWMHRPGSKVNLVTDSIRMAWDVLAIHSHAVRGHYDEPHLAPFLVAAEGAIPAAGRVGP